MWSVCSRTVGTALLLTSLVLVGCVTQNNRAETPLSQGQIVADPIRRVDLQPRFPQRVRTVQTTDSESAPAAANYYGDQTPEAMEAPKLGPGAQRALMCVCFVPRILHGGQRRIPFF